MKTSLNRRQVLRAASGVALGLPLLETFTSPAQAATPQPPFAIFFRQANGVQQGGTNGEIGNEPERFWPTSAGALTPATMQGRAVGQLSAFADRLLMVRCNMANFDYGDGHARGALQGLTARGPTVLRAGGNSEAAGESLDHRIGRELNPGGRDSLYLYAGQNSGWLGGACISYRASGQRRAAQNNPWQAYQSFVAGGGVLSPEAQAALAARGKSVNDLVRGQLAALLQHPRLSRADRDRLQLHQQSLRDLEVRLTCKLAEDNERTLERLAPGFNSTDGNEVLETARLHLEVAALAVACGHTRSAAIQVGNGNDGSTRYRHPVTGALMENFHYISHRRMSHDSSGAILAGSDLLHHHVDVQFAQTFRHLLEKLDAYRLPSGGTLLQAGLAVWYNDLGDGPPHSPLACPFIIGGSAGGVLKQGLYLALERSWNASSVQHRQVLNTIGAAVGLRTSTGQPLDDFGDPSSPGGRVAAMLA